ncbi:Ras-related protein Rab [Acrasis kona]|uniref:Ras-related protein Rab n=1 Tax=Acrasis kona TaxID=1008807 RepID=A0AAW2YXX3_9EUKA
MTDDASCDFLVKIVIIGDSGVGKTNLMTRFTKNEFLGDSKSTIGVEFARHLITLPNNKKVLAQIWDTAGQERFRALGPNFYRGAKGSICVYNITNLDSFNNVERWITEFNKHAESNPMSILLGNKCDLEDMRAVTTAQGTSFAEKNNMLFMETSAKQSTNVTSAFESLLIRITDNMCQSPIYDSLPPIEQTVLKSSSSPVNLIDPYPTKKKSCCG